MACAMMRTSFTVQRFELAGSPADSRGCEIAPLSYGPPDRVDLIFERAHHGQNPLLSRVLDRGEGFQVLHRDPVRCQVLLTDLRSLCWQPGMELS
jgi:hypothetical protein